MPARGARDRDRVEVGGLDHDAGRGVAQLGVLAAHDAGDADGATVVGDDQVGLVQRAHDVVERGDGLARLRLAHHDRALQGVGVVAVVGLAGLEHHVVGDVDAQRDRAHATRGQALLHPARRLGGGVETLHRQRDEQRARLGLEHDGVAALARGRGGVGDDVAVADAEGLGRLACESAHAQAVAHVGGDGHVEDVVGDAHGLERRGADGPGGALVVGVAEHDDAGVVLAQAQLVLGADHAVGDVPVGLARADRERAGQRGARERDHDVVAGDEVQCAADDTARPVGVTGRRGQFRDLPALGQRAGGGVRGVLGADVDVAPADGLAVLLRLLDEVDDAADDDRPRHVAADGLDLLDLQPGADQRVRQLPHAEAGGQVGVLGDPALGCPHRDSPFSIRLNRTSPSTMSRMSAALLRNISVRSMPMPNAKPE